MQYLTTAHSGPLPAPASLRIRNLAGFPSGMGGNFLPGAPPGRGLSYLTVDGQTGQAVSLYTGLAVGDDGFVTVGRMEHCSPYALAGGMLWQFLAVMLTAAACVLWIMLMALRGMGRNGKGHPGPDRTDIEGPDAAGKAGDTEDTYHSEDIHGPGDGIGPEDAYDTEDVTAHGYTNDTNDTKEAWKHGD